MLTVAEFCDRFNACRDRREWAIANCRDLRHAWEILPPEDLIWAATRPGVLTDRELRLFACWCVRQVWHLLTDERSRNAVEVAERFVDGEATKAELAAARDVAWEAAAEAAEAAAASVWAAEAASASARAAQADWLRANCQPNWDVGCDSAAV